MAFRNLKLKIKAKTWKRDSYGLFDYETTNYSNQDLSVNRAGKIMRLNHQISYNNSRPSVKFNKGGQTESGLEEILFNVTETLEGIRICAEGTEEDDSNQLWTVVDRGDATRGYILKIGDIIKLGRIKFRISQIKVENQAGKKNANRRSIIDSIRDHMQVIQDPLLISTQGQDSDKNNKGSNAGNLCKICLYDKSDEEDDPLISPCKCIGSVKHVHLKCMQNWVKSKLNMQQNKNIVTILWKNLSCELCKEKLPITLTHNGEELSLIPFDNRITGSYVMMESFSKENDSTGVHLVDLSDNHNFKILNEVGPWS